MKARPKKIAEAMNALVVPDPAVVAPLKTNEQILSKRNPSITLTTLVLLTVILLRMLD